MINRASSSQSVHIDQRIVFGAACSWWDSIYKVGKQGVLPVCPHCKNVLYEVDTIEEWWSRVRAFEASNHAGYRQFVEWLQGKCFRTYHLALEAYTIETGEEVDNL